ncbi:hypothetical protein TNCV_610991 [Trichonephila clavipes]|nr:hypothetical protein TNCV_610991 [Trichonephila clavipes]
MYETSVPSVEDLITRISVAAEKTRDMPGIFQNKMLFQSVGKLVPGIFLSALKESGFLSVFIIYQIIDNVTVIESFVFNQTRAAGALRESN